MAVYLYRIYHFPLFFFINIIVQFIYHNTILVHILKQLFRSTIRFFLPTSFFAYTLSIFFVKSYNYLFYNRKTRCKGILLHHNTVVRKKCGLYCIIYNISIILLLAFLVQKSAIQNSTKTACYCNRITFILENIHIYKNNCEGVGQITGPLIDQLILLVIFTDNLYR